MGYPMNIGDAARVAGVTAKMIRHYEGFGLIRQARRTDSGYRQYSAEDVATLRFIRQSRSVGFSIKQIESLLGLRADAQRDSRDVKAVALEHIADLDRKMAEMAQMKAALHEIAAGCVGDERPDCPILSELSSDAGGRPPIAPPKATPTKRRHATERRQPSNPGMPQADGLTAWMHGLRGGGHAVRPG